jgi:uncharacterized protein YecT (DUF1311 family)
MTNQELIDILQINKECILYNQEIQCNPKCKRCYYHVADYKLIEAYNQLIEILGGQQ